MDSEVFKKRFGVPKDVILKNFLPACFDLSEQGSDKQKQFAKQFFKQTQIRPKLFTFWKEQHIDECVFFVEEFKKACNVLAKKLEIDPIE